MNHYFYKIEKGLEDFLSCKQTLYASPFITINDKGYTKHYFEEGKRICSKIGSGELRDINNLVGHMEMNYEDQLNMQYDGIRGGLNCLQNARFDLENNSLYDHIIQPYENPMNPGEPIFYYHSDHLGSASFLTDTNGYETQQLVYLPFGEDWVDMKYNTQQYDTPYKFNGKEKDEETGYNNYGARYYYDWASIWLSVDPMSDKYPHLTSYNYCANNPIMLIDPDGREIDDYFSYEGKYLGSDNAETDNVRIMNKETWDANKYVDDNGNESINHSIGSNLSRSFSESADNMTDNAKLDLFQHYNSVNLPLEKYINAGDKYMCFNFKGLIDSKGNVVSVTHKSILINLQIDKTSDNVNNIINSFGHEQDHYDLFQEVGATKYNNLPNNFIEQRAIKKQITLPSWNKTTKEYRYGIKIYGYKHGMFPIDFKGY